MRRETPQRKREPAGSLDARVRAQLERILASEIFSRSERLSAFLRFVVTATLDEREGRLKEQAEDWLADCGLNLEAGGGERGYVAEIRGLPDVRVLKEWPGNPPGTGVDATNPANDVIASCDFINRTPGFSALLQAYLDFQPVRGKTVSRQGCLHIKDDRALFELCGR